MFVTVYMMGLSSAIFSPFKPSQFHKTFTLNNFDNLFSPNSSSSSSSLPKFTFKFHGSREFLLFHSSYYHFATVRRGALPESRSHELAAGDEYATDRDYRTEDDGSSPEADPQGNTAIISACVVGLLTGISVVIFNIVVHEIRDLCWDGIPYRGASWLREESTDVLWQRVVLVPAAGGLIVGMLNYIRGALEVPTGVLASSLKYVLEPILKAVAACITLGTGNSLGPEGPSVEIGSSIAKGVGKLFDKRGQSNLSLTAAGSAAGIASGFNAAVAGCFFAIESVLWPSPAESSLSLTNTTSTVILSAVIASVVSEIGLGSEPAFTVPGYDFRSPSELPLYLLLGILCGVVSLSLSRCTTFMIVSFDNFHKNVGVPKAAFPVFGGLAVGLIALQYPEILYWGFDNVDVLLESRPFMKTLSADLLLQLVAVKIVATSLCRASGLVGGYYAPSLFIGAATGMAYGKLVGFVILQFDPILHVSFLEVASPQAYGLVGMAATLAGVCQVPLTAVLLLFELTQDYRIVLPLLGAVGLSSWTTSGYTSRKDVGGAKKIKEEYRQATKQPSTSSIQPNVSSYTQSVDAERFYSCGPHECQDLQFENDMDNNMIELAKKIPISEAMRTQYVKILMGTFLGDAVTHMLAAKQSCAVILDEESQLIGLLTLEDIRDFSKLSEGKSKWQKELLVSDLCDSNDEIYKVSQTVTPSMNLFSAHSIMNCYGMSRLLVILEHGKGHRGAPVGLVDRECISVACRAFETKELLCGFSPSEEPNN